MADLAPAAARSCPRCGDFLSPERAVCPSCEVRQSLAPAAVPPSAALRLLRNALLAGLSIGLIFGGLGLSSGAGLRGMLWGGLMTGAVVLAAGGFSFSGRRVMIAAFTTGTLSCLAFGAAAILTLTGPSGGFATVAEAAALLCLGLILASALLPVGYGWLRLIAAAAAPRADTPAEAGAPSQSAT